jgi:hypothetical protein
MDDRTADPLGTWAAERSALAAEILRGSGRVRLQVHGESMLPTLWPRDVVDIASCRLEDVRPGEIVLALDRGRFFLHRFVERRGNGFLLQGDSMPARDPQFPEEALLGRLVGCASHAFSRRAFNDGSDGSEPLLPLRPWSRVLGQLICHCGPARRLALRVHFHLERRGNGFQESERAVLDGITDPGVL